MTDERRSAPARPDAPAGSMARPPVALRGPAGRGRRDPRAAWAAGPTAELATFAATLEADALPPDVRHQVKRLLLDTIGCMLGGCATETGRRSTAWAREAAGAKPPGIVGASARVAGPTAPGEAPSRAASVGPDVRPGARSGSATVVGAGDRLTPMLAAYANGRLAAVLDADETYPGARQVSHLAAATVAAALAGVERRGGTGAELVAAIVAGYEVGARLSNAVIPAEGPGSRGLRAGWGPGSPIGATAAAARAAGLDATATAHAIGLAGLHVDPPPLQWTEVRPAPMAKSADAGWHALTAVASAGMAEKGLTGYDAILDGPNGLWRGLGYAACDEAALTEDLGTRWIVLDAAFKAWPCQYWMHPALTALQRVLAEHAIRPDEIERIVLATNEKSLSAKFHDPDPPGEIDRAFSFPHAAAMLTLGVPPGPAWAADHVADASAVRRIRALVDVTLHPDAPRFPEWVVAHQVRDLPASAAVQARGTTFRAESRFGLGSPWSAESRLDDEALAAKLRAMAAPVGAGDPDWPERLDAAIEWLMDVDQQSSLDPLLDLITARRTPGTTRSATRTPTGRRR